MIVLERDRGRRDRKSKCVRERESVSLGLFVETKMELLCTVGAA